MVSEINLSLSAAYSHETRKNLRIHNFLHTHTPARARRRTYIRTYIHTILLRLHTYTQTHTYAIYIYIYIYIYIVIYMYVRTFKCTSIHVPLYLQHGEICSLYIYCHNNYLYKAYHDVYSLRWWRFSNPKLTHDKQLCLVLLTNLSWCYGWLTLRLYNYYTQCAEDIRISILCLCKDMLIRPMKEARSECVNVGERRLCISLPWCNKIIINRVV
jgi:hypothetical protein